MISPDGDGRFDHARIRYRLSERAVVELYVDGTRAIRKLGTRPRGTTSWTGNAGAEQLPEGVYTLRLVARDVAGNLGPRSGSRTVRIRFLELGRDRVVTTPGGRFAILVLSQARRVEWQLGGRSGTARPGTLQASGAPSAGAVHAPCRGERAREARRRPRAPGGVAVSTAAQAAAVVGAGGLAALLLAPGRWQRLAGLCAWGAGLAVLGIYLLPDLSTARLAAGAVGGLVAAFVLAWALDRWPYLLAFATLACIPLRIPVDIGS